MTTRNNAAASLKSLSDVLRQVSYAVRLEILLHLAESPCDVSTLAAALELGISVVSGHLAELAAHALVTCRAQGRRRIYSTGETVRFTRTTAGIEVSLSVSPDTALRLTLARALVERLKGPTPSSRMELTPRAAVLAPRDGAPSAPRLASAPGSE